MTLLALLLSCTPGQTYWICDRAVTADANALCEACPAGSACREVLEAPDAIELSCDGVPRAASLGWAVDHAQRCEVREVFAAPTCPAPEPVPLAPPILPIAPTTDFGGHIEREASIAFDLEGIRLAGVADLIYDAVMDDLAALSDWATPPIVGAIAGIGPSAVFRPAVWDLLDPCCSETTMVDVYLDRDRRLLDAQRGYRFRLRFGNPLDELAFESAMSTGAGKGLDSGNHPTEMQFQAGSYLYTDERGVSYGEERTLWFALGFPPFVSGPEDPCHEEDGCDYPLPPQPWDPAEWLPSAQSGLLQLDGVELVPLPSEWVADWLAEHGGPAALEPVVTTVSTRRRFELLLRYPGVLGLDNRPCRPDELGCPGPEEEESFLVSVDQTDVLSGTAWMEFVSGRSDRRPPVLTTFREVEVELQKDTLDPIEVLAGADDPGAPGAALVLAALELDHWHLVDVVNQVLVDQGLHPTAAVRAKYERATDEGAFVRGDVDRDGAVGLADALAIARALDGAPVYLPAADLDLDVEVTRADLDLLLAHLFLGGAEPAEPFEEGAAVPCL